MEAEPSLLPGWEEGGGMREVTATFDIRGERQTMQFEMAEEDTPSSVALDLLEELGLERTAATLTSFVHAIEAGLAAGASTARI